MKFLSLEVALLYLYKSTTHPCMEYCCHVWAGAPSCYLELLDKLQERICRTVGPSLAACLEPFSSSLKCGQLKSFLQVITLVNVLQTWLNWFHFLFLEGDSLVFCFVFFLSGFCFTNIHESQDCRGRGDFFNSSLPVSPASRALRHQPGDCRGGLTPAHTQQPGLSQEPLISQRKSLTTKLRAPKLRAHSLF